jgi:protein phosphatase inhibitor 2
MGVGNAINWSHLENKLGAVAAARDICPSSPSMSSVEGGLGNSSGPDSDVEADRKRRLMKKKEFAMHRKNHYNEMDAVRKWKSDHQDDDDDDDDE